jgi:hypothetical protein
MQGDRRNGGSELQERLHNNDRPASARKWLQPPRARAGSDIYTGVLGASASACTHAQLLHAPRLALRIHVGLLLV